MEIKKTFPIKGMHCASCVRVIERALSRVEGVSAASVNLATEQASVAYDPQVVTDQTLSSAIEGVGYKAVLEQKLKTEDEQKQEKQKELRKLRSKVIVSLFLGAIIVVGGFFGLTPLVQLLLAIPVQFWVGLEFCRATIPALKNRTANMDTLVAIGTSVAFGYSAFVTVLPQV